MNPTGIDSTGLRTRAIRWRLATWALVYGILVIYVSIVIGPGGFHFVPRDRADAWRSLLAIQYVANESDQRADWMANLAMLIPFGFLLMGALWTQKTDALRWLRASLVFICCLAFVIAVKYLQLFFPPRTVTLNYIVAQGIGAALGIILFCAFHRSLFAPRRTSHDRGRRALNIVLRTYAIGAILYVLFPFDFVLSAGDLRDRAAALPMWLFSWPGEGRPTGIRFILVLANIVETLPIGMMLALGKRNGFLMRIAVTGLILMSAVAVATMFVMSATPHLVSIIFRTIGIVIGAAVVMQSRHISYGKLRLFLARLVPIIFVPYVLSVLFINGLLSGHWLTLSEASAALDYRGLLPLWHYYIVSKAHAMASLGVHLVTFVPIGVMISLRDDNRTSRAPLAAVIAFIFSFLIEVGRGLKPGLQPDFNDAVIAAVAAWLAVKAMPLIWQMAESLSSSDAHSNIPEHAARRRAK